MSFVYQHASDASLRHQLGNAQIQSDGDFRDVDKRDVVLAPFNATQVRPIKPGKVCQCFLRNPLR